jgi:hypothetical protein
VAEIQTITDEEQTELEKYREHSILLNSFCWMTAQHLGLVHAGQGMSLVDIPDLMLMVDNKLSEIDGLNQTIALLEDAIDRAGLTYIQNPDAPIELTDWILVPKENVVHGTP